MKTEPKVGSLSLTDFLMLCDRSGSRTMDAIASTRKIAERFWPDSLSFGTPKKDAASALQEFETAFALFAQAKQLALNGDFEDAKRVFRTASEHSMKGYGIILGSLKSSSVPASAFAGAALEVSDWFGGGGVAKYFLARNPSNRQVFDELGIDYEKSFNFWVAVGLTDLIPGGKAVQVPVKITLKQAKAIVTKAFRDAVKAGLTDKDAAEVVVEQIRRDPALREALSTAKQATHIIPIAQRIMDAKEQIISGVRHAFGRLDKYRFLSFASKYGEVGGTKSFTTVKLVREGDSVVLGISPHKQKIATNELSIDVITDFFAWVKSSKKFDDFLQELVLSGKTRFSWSDLSRMVANNPAYKGSKLEVLVDFCKEFNFGNDFASSITGAVEAMKKAS